MSVLKRFTPAADDLVDAGFLLVLGVLGLLGFSAAYGGSRPVITGTIGLLLGILVAFASLRMRHSVATTILIGVVIFFLFGGAIVLQATTLAGLPTGPTITGLVDGAVHGWRGLLTTVPPSGAVGSLAVIPYLCGLACGLVGFTLARRLKASWPPVLPPAVVLVLGILFGTTVPVSLLLQGAAFVIVLLLWVSVRHARGRVLVQGVSPWSKLVSAAVLLAVIGAGAVFVGPHLPLASANERYVLRDHTDPPFDPRAYPSPLSRMRLYASTEKGKTIFAVSGVPKGARIKLATMDLYDGTVWSVAGGVGKAVGSSGYFERVGDTIPTTVTGDPATVTVKVGEYDNVWIPTVGAATAVRFGEDGRAAALGDGFRYNRETNEAVTTARLTSGDTVTMDVIVPPTATEKQIAGLPKGPDEVPEARGVASAVKEKVTDLVGEATTAGDKAVALATALRETGFYSSGLQGQTPSLPGHGERRLGDFLNGDALIGDAEQYAATAALMAREVDLPSRVVLGWIPDTTGEYKATGDKATAWIEVLIDGVGWVPLDVTPDRKRVYNEQVDQPQPQPQPQVQLPPPPLDLADPVAAPFDEVTEDKKDDKAPPPATNDSRLLGLVAVIVGLPLLVIVIPTLVIVLLKRRRRSRRRSAGDPADRIAGGWDEVIDRTRDTGHPLPVNATRSETAESIGAGTAALLASRADRAVFSTLTPDDAEAAEYWAIVDDLVKQQKSSLGLWARFKAAISLTSLRNRR